MPQIEIKVFGKVQGVFFRSYIKEIADKLEIIGSVKNNLDDGMTVYIIAVHKNEDLLKDFIELVQQGSPLSDIDRIEVSWTEAEKEILKEDHFVISY